MNLMEAYTAQPAAVRADWLAHQRQVRGPCILSSLDYLILRLQHSGCRALLAEIPDEPGWGLLRDVLRLAAPALDAAPELLPGQLLGRLGSLELDIPRAHVERYAPLLRAAADRRGLLPLTANLTRPVRPLLGTLRGHRDFVGGLVVLPGDEVAVSASEDGTIRTWDLVKMVPLQVLTAHTGPVNRLLLLPGGRQLVSCSDDRTVRIWDVASMLCVAVLEGHSDYVSAMACTPDGRTLLSAGRDGAVLVWDLPSRALRQQLDGHSAWVIAAAVSPDGRLAVTASISNELLAWDLRTLEPTAPFHRSRQGGVRYVLGDIFVGDNNTSGVGHQSYARALAFSGDGRQLISARDGLIVWDVESRRQLRRLRGHAWPIDAMAMLPGGRAVTGAHSIKIWDLQAGVPEATLPGHDGNDIDAIVPLRGGRLLTSGHDGTLRLWDPAIAAESIHTGRVSGLRFSPCGGHLVSAASDSSLRVWSTTDGHCAHVLGGMSGVFAQVKGFAAGGVVGASSSGDLRVWDLETGRLRAAMRHPSACYSIEGVDISPDGRLAVAGAVGAGLTLWDLTAGGGPLSFHGRGRFLSHVRLADDGDSVITAASYQGGGEPGSLQRWSLSSRSLCAQHPLDGAAYATGMHLFSRGGRQEVLVAGSQGTLYRACARTLQIAQRAQAGGGREWVQLLPGGDDVVTLHKGVLCRWDPADLSSSVRLGCVAPRAALAVRDGDHLAYAVGEDVFLWSLSRAERLGRFRADGRVSALALRGDRLAIGEHSGRVHLIGWVA